MEIVIVISCVLSLITAIMVILHDAYVEFSDTTFHPFVDRDDYLTFLLWTLGLRLPKLFNVLSTSMVLNAVVVGSAYATI